MSYSFSLQTARRRITRAAAFLRELPARARELRLRLRAGQRNASETLNKTGLRRERRNPPASTASNDQVEALDPSSEQPDSLTEASCASSSLPTTGKRVTFATSPPSIRTFDAGPDAMVNALSAVRGILCRVRQAAVNCQDIQGTAADELALRTKLLTRQLGRLQDLRSGTTTLPPVKSCNRTRKRTGGASAPRPTGWHKYFRGCFDPEEAALKDAANHGDPEAFWKAIDRINQALCRL
jgi:hypothetical protein